VVKQSAMRSKALRAGVGVAGAFVAFLLLIELLARWNVRREQEERAYLGDRLYSESGGRTRRPGHLYRRSARLDPLLESRLRRAGEGATGDLRRSPRLRTLALARRQIHTRRSPRRAAADAHRARCRAALDHRHPLFRCSRCRPLRRSVSRSGFEALPPRHPRLRQRAGGARTHLGDVAAGCGVLAAAGARP